LQNRKIEKTIILKKSTKRQSNKDLKSLIMTIMIKIIIKMIIIKVKITTMITITKKLFAFQEGGMIINHVFT